MASGRVQVAVFRSAFRQTTSEDQGDPVPARHSRTSADDRGALLRKSVVTLQGIITKAVEFLQEAFAAAEDLAGLIRSLGEQIEAFGGHEAMLAVWIVLGAIMLVTAIKLAKVAIAVVQYLVVPALIIAILLWLVLHQPFLTMLPLSAIGCSVFFLVKA